MAGSFNHIVNSAGRFYMDCIDNMGDAQEALEDCFAIIYALADDGDTNKVRKACKKANSVDPWKDTYGDDPKKDMTI
jgi:hypothetical protein